MDELTGSGEAAAQVGGDAGQGAATEAAGTAAQTETGVPQTSQEWKVGDTTFKNPSELHQGALRWQAEYTRANQARAAAEKEMGGYKAVFQAVSQDPRLRQEVLQRMQGGQSQQQAVQQTAQAHPEMLSQFNSLRSEIQQLQQFKTESEQDRAQYEFLENHKDVDRNGKEWNSMAEWIGKSAEWLMKAGLTPQQMIDMAYHNVVLPGRFKTMSGQQAQQEAMARGQATKPLLGSQASSAGARAVPQGRPKGKLTPKQEHDYAVAQWAKNKKG